jgi:lambda family phage portal protein
MGGTGGGLFKNIETFPGQILYTPPSLSARQEGRMARRDAVRAARHAERTSEHIRGGIDTKSDMVVGALLRVHAQPDWDALGIEDWATKKPFAKACQREFNNWANDTRLLQDAEGHYNFGGLMWMAFRNTVGPDAECAGIIHYDEERQARYNATWATFVTILDPDRIQTPPEETGNPNVFEGKLLDEHGRMTGFWVTKQHPSEGVSSLDDIDPIFVPRETPWGRAVGFHWFIKTRGGQQRGVTNLVTVLRKTGMLDGFDDAYLGSAVVNQVLSNYIETMASPETVAEQLAPAGKDGKSPWDMKLDYYDRAKIRIGGVRIPTMPPGDKVMMTAVNRAIGDPSSFRNGFLREFASAIGVSFEQISKNFSEANYSSARAALLEVWRGVLTQRRLFTAHVASLIYAAVIEEAIYKGRIELPSGAPPFQENRAAYTACAWTGPGMGWIDPQKEATATQILLALKLKSRAEAKAEMDGGDYLETFDQCEQESIEADERNLVLDPLPPGTKYSALSGENMDNGGEPGDGSVSTAKPKSGSGGSTTSGDQ